MNTRKTKVLIVGAGPAGLACARELSKAGVPFILLEKESSVGGLARTYTFEEDGLVFRTDNGPHRFFSKNKYLYEFIEELLQEKWITVRRQTRQLIDGKFYDYPINLMQALRNIGFLNAVLMGIDYAYAQIHYKLLKKPIVSFEDYVVANFGKRLGRFNMINYTEKIWGIPATTIHPDWAGQRIKGLDFGSVIKNALQRIFKRSRNEGPKTLIESFYYPQFGTGLIYETITNDLKERGYEVICDAKVRSVVHNKHTIEKVIVEKDGEEFAIECETLIESIPLPAFTRLFSPSVPQEIEMAARELRHRSQVYLFITLDKPSITLDQWIYFPTERVPFARVSEMKNFSADMSPHDKTSLFVEFFCFKDDAVWNMSQDELFELAIPHFEELGFFTRSEVRRHYHIKKEDIYPIYDLEYKKYLSVVKDYLDRFENLYYIGRPGRFKYNNQDHSLEMGILAAKSIIDNTRYDIESVGEEKEYFEKGAVPTKTTE
ncbi:MAG: FAD-dependent oxidoreductase [Patescibacteria group bacterium]